MCQSAGPRLHHDGRTVLHLQLVQVDSWDAGFGLTGPTKVCSVLQPEKHSLVFVRAAVSSRARCRHMRTAVPTRLFPRNSGAGEVLLPCSFLNPQAYYSIGSSILVGRGRDRERVDKAHHSDTNGSSGLDIAPLTWLFLVF